MGGGAQGLPSAAGEAERAPASRGKSGRHRRPSWGLPVADELLAAGGVWSYCNPLRVYYGMDTMHLPM